MGIKCSVYIAASIDGFIAKPDGDIEWLDRFSTSELNGLSFNDFMSTVDTLVMGRNTFDKVLSFEHWPYEAIPVVVLTSRKLVIPEYLQSKVRVESGSPDKLLSKLESEGKRHLYIDGGNTIQRFLQARLIHEMTITWVPLLLGKGISLFDSFGTEIPLRLIATTTSKNGFVQVRYELASPA